MLPLRILGVLWLMFSPCGTESRCPSDLNPLIVEPAEVVEVYGASLFVNCSSSAEEHEGIYWRVGDKDVSEEEDWNFIAHNLSLSDYNITAQCKIKLTETYECSKDVEITVYKNPEVVSAIKHAGATGQETQYDLRCDVFNVAPVQNLIVKWYKDNETIMTKEFNSSTKTPVNETVTLPVNISRSEGVVQLRCEAQLDFGPRGVQLPVVSQTHNISALYAPEMKTKESVETKVVTKGENVTLNCEAEGNPPPVFSWTCDGVDMLERTDNVSFAPVNLFSICKCVATNHLGNTTKTYQIVRLDHPAKTAPKPQTPRACPLTLTPPEIVARFGDPVSADCNTSATDAVGMGWESPVEGTGFEPPPHVPWSVKKLEDWFIRPFCYITLADDYQCNVTLPITLYKTPDRVSVSGPEYGLEGNDYELKCNIDNVAPVNKLKVSWYQDDQEHRTIPFSETSLTPLSVSSTLIINATRDYNGSIFRCEAVLHLGPNGPERVPTTSANYIAVVQYAPEMKTKNRAETKVVTKGENVTLSCEAEGNPPPVFSWTCDGVDMLERTDNVSFAPVNPFSICNCVATNHLGNTTKTYQIVRLDPPAKTAPKPQTPRACPLTLTPPEIVARFGDPVSADCNTSATDAVGMGWESPVEGTGFEPPPHVPWSVKKLEDWFIRPFCYITLADDYQCNVTLPITLYKTPDRVSVSGPEYGLEGNDYELKCNIDNVAPVSKLKVSWYKDDQEHRTIPFSETSLTPLSVSSTLIVNATRDYNGSIFRCEAVLHLGPNGPERVPTTSANYIAVVQYKPLFEYCPSRHSVVENEFSLNKYQCQVHGNPPPKVQWFYDGEVVDSSKPLRRNDTGNYMMRIVNRHGSSNTSVYITVEYRPSIDCDDRYKIELSTHIQTPCQPKGLPSPTLTWLKGGKKMTQWTKNDSGKYVLQATNAHGTATHTLYLDILYAPEIKESNQTMEVAQGENVTLHCEAEGNPPPVVLWLFNSSVAPDVNSRWHQKTITVTAATSTSAGVYSCIARNRVGNVTRTVSLVIQGKSRGFSYKFVWVFVIIFIILFFLVLAVLLYIRQKKHGHYKLIRTKAASNIPLTPRSTGGNL